MTASLDSVHFLRPCRLGSVAIIAAMVNRTFASSMEVHPEVVRMPQLLASMLCSLRQRMAAAALLRLSCQLWTAACLCVRRRCQPGWAGGSTVIGVCVACAHLSPALFCAQCACLNMHAKHIQQGCTLELSEVLTLQA